MKQLNEEKIKLIEKYYKENKDENNYIKKVELAGAIRKFISRYLAGKRSQSEIGEDKMLFDYLMRVDLWEKNIDDPKFEKEFFKLSKIEITVGEGKDFYDKLGGDNDVLNLFVIDEEIVENNKTENIIEDEDKNENINDKIKEKDDEEEEEEINDRNRKNEINEVDNRKNFNRRKLF